MCEGRLSRPKRRQLPPPEARAHDAVVVEHRNAISRQPDVALQAGRAEAQRQGEGLDRVLPGVRLRATVGERDRALEQRRESLLHAARSCQPPAPGGTVNAQDRRIETMFNLSGSEIVIILLLALVILGPEKLPDFLRRAGRTYAELKKLGNNFQSEMRSVLDEPMKEMRETADLLQKSTQLEDHEPSEPGAGGGATPAPARPRRARAPASPRPPHRLHHPRPTVTPRPRPTPPPLLTRNSSTAR